MTRRRHAHTRALRRPAARPAGCRRAARAARERAAARARPLARLRGAGRASSAAMQPQAVVGLTRPALPGRRATRRTRRARRRPRGRVARRPWPGPTSAIEPRRQRASASTLSSMRRELPLLLELARERVDRVLPHLHRAARPERPAVGPRREPPGAPTREPAAVLGANHAQRGEAIGLECVHQPQRPAHGLELELAASRRRRCHRRGVRPGRRATASRGRAARHRRRRHGGLERRGGACQGS